MPGCFRDPVGRAFPARAFHGATARRACHPRVGSDAALPGGTDLFFAWVCTRKILRVLDSGTGAVQLAPATGRGDSECVESILKSHAVSDSMPRRSRHVAVSSRAFQHGDSLMGSKTKSGHHIAHVRGASRGLCGRSRQVTFSGLAFQSADSMWRGDAKTLGNGLDVFAAARGCCDRSRLRTSTPSRLALQLRDLCGVGDTVEQRSVLNVGTMPGGPSRTELDGAGPGDTRHRAKARAANCFGPRFEL
jgi:hypothetical protein